MADGKKMAESQSTAVKKLKATAAAGAHQKEWFTGLKARVEAGEDFGYLNADVPMEVLRAMDIPFVVNQWWAAICGAKRMTKKYYGLLREAGYRDDLCSYCATAFAESLDPDDHKLDAEGRPLGPWGGLPDPTIAITRLTCDCQSKIFELFAQNHGASFYAMENTVARKTPLKWFELAPDRWEELYDTDRLDTAVEELKELIRFLEMKTGKMFDINKLEHVMNLINEQEMWYKKTRDLIAACHPVPVTVVDTINAVMQAQWQRGTQWAADHAKSLYEEVKALADKGAAAVPNEKYRLMWIGRGIWHDFSFYQRFEQKYGASSGNASGGMSASFTVVTLNQGQILYMGVGCEVMLRTGSGVCVAASTPGLIDETSGAALAGGRGLQKNHLYMATVDSRGVQASANSTKLLVRGNYSVQ